MNTAVINGIVDAITVAKVNHESWKDIVDLTLINYKYNTTKLQQYFPKVQILRMCGSVTDCSGFSDILELHLVDIKNCKDLNISHCAELKTITFDNVTFDEGDIIHLAKITNAVNNIIFIHFKLPESFDHTLVHEVVKTNFVFYVMLRGYMCGYCNSIIVEKRYDEITVSKYPKYINTC